MHDRQASSAVPKAAPVAALIEALEAAFALACSAGTPPAFRSWASQIEALLRRPDLFGLDAPPVPALRELSAAIKFQIARIPPRHLSGRVALLPALCAFAHALETVHDAGLTHRAHGLLAMLAGRMGLRGWTGRRDPSLLAAFDQVYRRLLRKPQRIVLESWFLLFSSAHVAPEAMREERDFFLALADHVLESARHVPHAWLAPRRRLGTWFARLAEAMVRTRDPELTARGCEIAETVTDRKSGE